MTDVKFRVLGPVRLFCAGQQVAMSGPTALTVLTALLLSANRAVPLDTLADIVWGDHPPARPHAALHSAVSRLRRAVGREMIESAAHGYCLRVAAGQLDLLRSEELAAVAAAAQARGDAESAAAALSEAIGLWQFPLLSNVGSAALHGDAARLTEKYLGMQEDRAGLFLRLGRHAALTELLPPLIREYPFRERLVGHLMLALVRGGRQAEALAAYESLRGTLAAELGIDPSPSLQELHVRILRADAELTSALPAVPTPAPMAGIDTGHGAQVTKTTEATEATKAGRPGRPSWRGRRPAADDLVGRDDDIGTLAAAVMKGRAVTLTGPAGVGKTSVALAAAGRLAGCFADGVVVVELGLLPARRPDAGQETGGPGAMGEVADAVRLALGASAAPGQTADDALTTRLGRAQLLLVLDNAEHVAAATGSVTDLVVRSCPRVRVLVTSRRPLGLGGEAVVELAPLDPGRTAELLRLRASAHRPAPELDTDRGAVAELCAILDGLPLAVELAAARLRAMPLRTLLDRIRSWLGVLAAPARPGLPHQRALDATLRWSYDLLTEHGAILLGRLAVFAGSFTLESAERVCGYGVVLERDVAGLLSSLVDDCLVQAVRDRDRYRYRLLIPVRDFAIAQLPAAELAAVRAQHLRCLGETAASNERQGGDRSPDGEYLATIALESGFSDLLAFADLPPPGWHASFSDLLAAWDWALQGGREVADAELAARLLLTSRAAWEPLPGAASSVLHHVMRALRLRGLPAPLAAYLTLLAGNLHYRLGDPAGARHLLERALHLLERLPAKDPGAPVAALSDLALIAFSQAAHDAAGIIHASADAARRTRDRKVIAVTLAKAASMFAQLGHIGEAERLIEEAAAAAGDDTALLRHHLPRRAAVRLRAGQVADARRDTEQVLAMLDSATTYEKVGALLAHGWALALDGDTAAARKILASGAALAEERQVPVLLPGYFLALAYLEHAAEQAASAVVPVCRAIRLALSHQDLVTAIAALHLATAIACDTDAAGAGQIATAVRDCRIRGRLSTWPFSAEDYARYEGGLKVDVAAVPAAGLSPGAVAAAADLALAHIEA